MPTLTKQRTVVLALGLVLAHVIILKSMGRIDWCDCGLHLWTWDAWGSSTSQNFGDPYTFSHILHGVLFFWFLLVFRKELPIEWRLLIASIIEIGWEILENSPIIINRYRSATASFGYTGDSILNSTGDVIAAMLGFFLAYKLGWKWTLAVVVVIELTMLITMRDNLSLNIIMLLYPLESIKNWQIAH
jgi:hypothetical protein